MVALKAQSDMSTMTENWWRCSCLHSGSCSDADIRRHSLMMVAVKMGIQYFLLALARVGDHGYFLPMYFQMFQVNHALDEDYTLFLLARSGFPYLTN